MLPFSYAVRNLWRRGARTLLTLVGIALITVLVVLMMGFAQGLSHTAESTASPEVAVIVSVGKEYDLVRSSISKGNASVVAANLPGVAVVNGQRAISLELHVATRRGNQIGALRGVEPAAFLVHERVTLIAGREPALPWELLAGRLAESRIGLTEGSLDVGRTVELEGRPWTVVGRFAAPGTVLEAEMWGRLEDVLQATRRQDVSSVSARLTSVAAMEDAELWVARNGLAYEVGFVSEPRLYESLAQALNPITLLARLMAGLVIVGGVFACTNTMFAAVLARTREMGTLRALGYSPAAVGLSLVEESMLLAAIGGLAGFFVAGLFGEVPLKFPMGAFYLDLTAPVRLAGLGAALLAGLLGGLVPAFRAIRMPLVDALGDKL